MQLRGYTTRANASIRMNVLMLREVWAGRPFAHMQRMRSMSTRSFPALERSPATGSKALQRLFFSSATIPPQHSKLGPLWPKIGTKIPAYARRVDFFPDR